MSDLAKPHPYGTETPGLIAGSAAANTAGAGTPKQPGKELGTTAAGDDRAHVYKDIDQ